jgi:hypothetical protein
MERLEIEQSKSTPFVQFDPESGMLEIGGESYPENSHEFFSPVIEWIDQYLSEGKHSISFIVTLTYMNTSSTKYMIDILDRLEQAHEKGRNISVKWYCDGDNEREMDTVEELREDFEMPFEVKTREIE